MDNKQNQLIVIITFLITSVIVVPLTAIIVFDIAKKQPQQETKTLNPVKTTSDIQSTYQNSSNQQTNQTVDEEENKSYSNSRFNFSLKYPKKYKEEIPSNNDGVILTNNSQEIRVYGANNQTKADNLSGYAVEVFGQSSPKTDYGTDPKKGLQISQNGDTYIIFMNKNNEIITVYSKNPALDTYKDIKLIADSLEF